MSAWDNSQDVTDNIEAALPPDKAAKKQLPPENAQGAQDPEGTNYPHGGGMGDGSGGQEAEDDDTYSGLVFAIIAADEKQEDQSADPYAMIHMIDAYIAGAVSSDVSDGPGWDAKQLEKFEKQLAAEKMEAYEAAEGNLKVEKNSQEVKKMIAAQSTGLPVPYLGAHEYKGLQGLDVSITNPEIISVITTPSTKKGNVSKELLESRRFERNLKRDNINFIFNEVISKLPEYEDCVNSLSKVNDDLLSNIKIFGTVRKAVDELISTFDLRNPDTSSRLMSDAIDYYLTMKASSERDRHQLPQNMKIFVEEFLGVDQEFVGKNFSSTRLLYDIFSALSYSTKKAYPAIDFGPDGSVIPVGDGAVALMNNVNGTPNATAKRIQHPYKSTPITDGVLKARTVYNTFSCTEFSSPSKDESPEKDGSRSYRAYLSIGSPGNTSVLGGAPDVQNKSRKRLKSICCTLSNELIVSVGQAKLKGTPLGSRGASSTSDPMSKLFGLGEAIESVLQTTSFGNPQPDASLIDSLTLNEKAIPGDALPAPLVLPFEISSIVEDEIGSDVKYMSGKNFLLEAPFRNASLAHQGVKTNIEIFTENFSSLANDSSSYLNSLLLLQAGNIGISPASIYGRVAREMSYAGKILSSKGDGNKNRSVEHATSGIYTAIEDQTAIFTIMVLMCAANENYNQIDEVNSWRSVLFRLCLRHRDYTDELNAIPDDELTLQEKMAKDFSTLHATGDDTAEINKMIPMLPQGIAAPNLRNKRWSDTQQGPKGGHSHLAEQELYALVRKKIKVTVEKMLIQETFRGGAETGTGYKPMVSAPEGEKPGTSDGAGDPLQKKEDLFKDTGGHVDPGADGYNLSPGSADTTRPLTEYSFMEDFALFDFTAGQTSFLANVVTIARDLQLECHALSTASSGDSYLDTNGLTRFNQAGEDAIIGAVLEVMISMFGAYFPARPTMTPATNAVMEVIYDPNGIRKQLFGLNFMGKRCHDLGMISELVADSINNEVSLDLIFNALSEDSVALDMVKKDHMGYYPFSQTYVEDLVNDARSLCSHRELFKLGSGILQSVSSHLIKSTADLKELINLTDVNNAQTKLDPLHLNFAKFTNTDLGKDALMHMTPGQTSLKSHHRRCHYPNDSNSYIPQHSIVTKQEQSAVDVLLKDPIFTHPNTVILAVGVPLGMIDHLKNPPLQYSDTAMSIGPATADNKVVITINRTSHLAPWAKFGNLKFEFDLDLFVDYGTLDTEFELGDTVAGNRYLGTGVYQTEENVKNVLADVNFNTNHANDAFALENPEHTDSNHDAGSVDPNLNISGKVDRLEHSVLNNCKFTKYTHGVPGDPVKGVDLYSDQYPTVSTNKKFRTLRNHTYDYLIKRYLFEMTGIDWSAASYNVRYASECHAIDDDKLALLEKVCTSDLLQERLNFDAESVVKAFSRGDDAYGEANYLGGPPGNNFPGLTPNPGAKSIASDGKIFNRGYLNPIKMPLIGVKSKNQGPGFSSTIVNHVVAPPRVPPHIFDLMVDLTSSKVFSPKRLERSVMSPKIFDRVFFIPVSVYSYDLNESLTEKTMAVSNLTNDPQLMGMTKMIANGFSKLSTRGEELGVDGLHCRVDLDDNS